MSNFAGPHTFETRGEVVAFLNRRCIPAEYSDVRPHATLTFRHGTHATRVAHYGGRYIVETYSVNQ